MGKASEVLKRLEAKPYKPRTDSIRLEDGTETFLPPNIHRMPTVEVEPTTTVLSILDQLADGSTRLVSLRRAEVSADDPINAPLEAVVLPIKTYLQLGALAHGEKPLPEPDAAQLPTTQPQTDM
jgi:hypothetical protein